MAGSSSTSTIKLLLNLHDTDILYVVHVHNISRQLEQWLILSLFLILHKNCHCREKSMLPTLWVLETFLFRMSNKACIPPFRHLGLTGPKYNPFESDNFEVCSVRPPVLSSGPSCHPFFKSFDSGVQGCQVQQQFTAQ